MRLRQGFAISVPVVWFGLFHLLGRGKLLAPNVIGNPWFQHVGVFVMAALLGVGLLLALEQALVDRYRKAFGAWSAFLALMLAGHAGATLYGAVMGFEIAASSLDPPFPAERLSRAALEGKNARNRAFAAQFAYRDMGARIGFRDEAGELRLFEPTTADVAKRDQERQSQKMAQGTASTVYAQSSGLMWVVASDLVVLALALVAIAFRAAFVKRQE